jgi:hypothetical protein
LNIILAHKDQGKTQNQKKTRQTEEGKTSFQSKVSRDLAKLEERNCKQKLKNS